MSTPSTAMVPYMTDVVTLDMKLLESTRASRCAVAAFRGFTVGRGRPEEKSSSSLASPFSNILPLIRLLLVAKHREQAFHVLTTRGAVAHVGEKLRVAIRHGLAAGYELAIRVHQLAGLLAAGVGIRAAEYSLKVQITHGTCSPWPASINARRSFARASCSVL